MQSMRELNERFVKGREGLTNEELDNLLCKYYDLGLMVDWLDPALSLFVSEIRKRHELLCSFKIAREQSTQK